MAVLTAFSLFAGMLLVTTPLRVEAIGSGAAGDAGEGKMLFEKRCGGCHSLDSNKEGPGLRHAYGNKAGSVATFKYSKGLLASGLTWDDAMLEKWLTSTESVAPDNDMAFSVASPAERSSIIRYLKAAAGQ